MMARIAITLTATSSSNSENARCDPGGAVTWTRRDLANLTTHLSTSADRHSRPLRYLRIVASPALNGSVAAHPSERRTIVQLRLTSQWVGSGRLEVVGITAAAAAAPLPHLRAAIQGTASEPGGHQDRRAREQRGRALQLAVLGGERPPAELPDIGGQPTPALPIRFSALFGQQLGVHRRGHQVVNQSCQALWVMLPH